MEHLAVLLSILLKLKIKKEILNLVWANWHNLGVFTTQQSHLKSNAGYCASAKPSSIALFIYSRILLKSEADYSPE